MQGKGDPSLCTKDEHYLALFFFRRIVPVKADKTKYFKHYFESTLPSLMLFMLLILSIHQGRILCQGVPSRRFNVVQAILGCPQTHVICFRPPSLPILMSHIVNNNNMSILSHIHSRTTSVGLDPTFWQIWNVPIRLTVKNKRIQRASTEAQIAFSIYMGLQLIRRGLSDFYNWNSI